MNVMIFDQAQLQQFEAETNAALAVEQMLILCLDFDGVLHTFKSGWQGATVIPDAPVDGAMEFLVKALQHFSVHIYSNRCNFPGGIEAMAEWLVKHIHKTFQYIMTEYDAQMLVSQIWFDVLKPPAHVTLDDHAYQFRGYFPSFEYLKQFQPWHTRQKQPLWTDQDIEKLWNMLQMAQDCVVMSNTDLAYALQNIWAQYNIDTKESWLLSEAIDRLLPKGQEMLE